MKKEETTLRQDIKTAWVDGCKDLVGWLQSFGQVERSEDRRKTDRGNDRRFNKFGEPEFRPFPLLGLSVFPVCWAAAV